ncbi:MAG: cytochrome C oxidase subunit II, partial [Methylocystis sp.]|nr:cytochrome C oxidase subunit II [Methylocystis sp.]
MSRHEAEILQAERRWTHVIFAVVCVIFFAVLYAGLALHVNPPSNIETIDPMAVHLSDEFTESNLGTRVEADGRVVVRFIATQFTFAPQCMVVPANEPVTCLLYTS